MSLSTAFLLSVCRTLAHTTVEPDSISSWHHGPMPRYDTVGQYVSHILLVTVNSLLMTRLGPDARN